MTKTTAAPPRHAPGGCYRTRGYVETGDGVYGVDDATLDTAFVATTPPY